MEDLELIRKKEKTMVEIEDNEANNVEIEEFPETQEEIIEDLKAKNESLREKYNQKSTDYFDLLYQFTKRGEEISWYKRYMNEHGIDFMKWKGDVIADYEKYGAMRPEERRDFDDKLERVREAMRRRRP